MVLIKDIIQVLTTLAHPSLQESYDNSGFITGNPSDVCHSLICCLDVTEQVIDEAVDSGANLIISHHPLLFRPIKSLTPSTPVERTLLKAIKQEIAIYAIHTNYDNVINGVNLAFAKKIGLTENTLKILSPMMGKLAKLYTYVPAEHAESLKTGLFAAGAGKIGLYDQCSFEASGTGNFRPLDGSNPFIGVPGGAREKVSEVKLEIIFPIWLKSLIIKTLKELHPYEEVAYEIILTENEYPEAGAGIIGELPAPISENDFLACLKGEFGTGVIRHSILLNKPLKKIAVCGGSGAFLIKKAIAAGADAFITADLKYHDFFEADGKILLADIGHGESEIGAMVHLTDFLREKFPTFAVLLSKVDTNPVKYFQG